MKRISISIEKELHEAVKKYCQKSGRTVSGLVKQLLKEELKK